MTAVKKNETVTAKLIARPLEVITGVNAKADAEAASKGKTAKLMKKTIKANATLTAINKLNAKLVADCKSVNMVARCEEEAKQHITDSVIIGLHVLKFIPLETKLVGGDTSYAGIRANVKTVLIGSDGVNDVLSTRIKRAARWAMLAYRAPEIFTVNKSNTKVFAPANIINPRLPKFDDVTHRVSGSYENTTTTKQEVPMAMTDKLWAKHCLTDAEQTGTNDVNAGGDNGGDNQGSSTDVEKQVDNDLIVDTYFTMLNDIATGLTSNGKPGTIKRLALKDLKRLMQLIPVFQMLNKAGTVDDKAVDILKAEIDRREQEEEKKNPSDVD